MTYIACTLAVDVNVFLTTNVLMFCYSFIFVQTILQEKFIANLLMKVFYWRQSIIRSVAKTNNTTKCASTQEKESTICVQM